MKNNALSSKSLLNHLGKIAGGSLPDATGAEPELYWNEDIAAAEEQNIFRKDWVCPGLAAELSLIHI